MSSPRKTVWILAFVIALTGVLADPARAAKKSKADTARESAKMIRARLAAVTQQLQAQEAKSQSAKQAAVAAQVRLRSARAEETAVGQRLSQVKQSIREIAVQAYIRGGAPQSPAAASVADLMQAARTEFIRNTALGLQEDAADALRAAREDVERKRQAAESAASVASSRQKAATNAVSSLRASQAEQLRLVGAAESRYQASLKESQLVSRSRRAPGSSISLTTVRGITVATRIAGNLERMLNAADADGVRLSGSGYRSPSGQVAARRRNCGSSSYAIYEMPSSRCRPPTAKPGQSMHEQGLAVDFTYNGSVINSRSNAGYRWLKGNAARYGFYNLPSEAWHWSINGN